MFCIKRNLWQKCYYDILAVDKVQIYWPLAKVPCKNTHLKQIDTDYL